MSVSRGEIAAGAFLDPVAPELDDLAARGRRRIAGQPFAHHQRDGVLERRVGAVGDLVVVAAVIAVLEHGGEVARHAAHAARAERLDPRLLDGVEDGAGVLALGRWARWTDGSWQARRSAIESPMPRVMATSRAVSLRGGSGRRALWPDEQRPVGGEADLEVGLAGNRAHAAGDRPLERLGRGFLALGAAVWQLEVMSAGY